MQFLIEYVCIQFCVFKYQRAYYTSFLWFNFFFFSMPMCLLLKWFHIFIHSKVVKVKSLSHVRLLATPWTVICQAPLPMGFSRQEYQSGFPFPSAGDLADPGIEPGLPHCRQKLYCLRHQASTICIQNSSSNLLIHEI